MRALRAGVFAAKFVGGCLHEGARGDAAAAEAVVPVGAAAQAEALESLSV